MNPSSSLNFLQPEGPDLFTMLRRETAAIHEKVMDEPWARRVLSSDYTRNEYLGLLQKYHGFYLPLETLLLGSLPTVFHSSRAKHPLLREDLMNLDAAHRFDRGTCARLPGFVDAPSALGICYVLEGATLGGQIIVKQLKTSLGFQGQEGIKFFTGYGPETALMWNGFKAQARDAVRTSEGASIMLAAALDTFQRLSDWMETA